MQAMKMVDLSAQQNLIRSQLDAAIANVLNSGDYILGKQVVELEKKLAEFCGAKFAISCANGTDALTLVLRAFNVSKHDAIFVPAFTFTATAEAVVLAGATPIFVDVLPNTFNMDSNSLSAAILVAKKNNLTPTGIIPVDLFGLPADYQAIQQIANDNNLWILCDAAQSFGASYFDKKVGVLGNATATSFFPSKPFGCYGDGGCIFTDDADLANILKSIRVHGAKIASNGTIDKYNNIRIGMNSRLDTIQAAILLEKLKIFPEELNLRNQVANIYHDLLKNLDNIILPTIAPSATSAWAQYTIKLNTKKFNNKTLQLALENAGIPSIIYYSKAISSHEPYADFPRADLSVAEQLSHIVLSLPMHPYLSVDAQQNIANILQNLLLTVCVV